MNSQQKAFKKFSEMRVGALFMQQGTGKTQVACSLINFNKKYVDKAYFFCPTSTKKNLQDEIEKCCLEIEYEIVGWETLSQSDRTYLRLVETMKNTRNFLVADESIFIKNVKTKRYNRIIELSKYSLFRICLNGTPIVKSEWDLYYQMQFLSPKIINMTELEFENKFFKYIISKKKGCKEKRWVEFSEVNAEYLTKLIEPYIFECSFEFEHQEYTEIISVLEEESTLLAYENTIKKELELLQLTEMQVLRMFNKLQSIVACDSEKCNQIAKDTKEKQVIIYCSRLLEVERIAKALNNECFVITGATTKTKRNTIFKSFKSESKPLLIMFGCGSFGLNLQFCNHIVYSSITFDYGKVEQSRARIRRTGQTRDIKYTYYRPYLKFYNVMYENLSKKETLSKIIKTKIEEGLECLLNDTEKKQSMNQHKKD